MRDLSTLAKLLAEEDINVVHKKQETAMFDVKNRELSLPIWKEMSKDIQDLMTIHEVGHALWTPLEQLEKANKENIEFSFVNVLEDVRIEKKVQDKYLGSVRIFNRGYQELIGNNFFGTKGRDISKLNLIDRINLHYKHHNNISFSDDEMVWVEKANQTVTPDDVLELAKELYQFMQDNQNSQGQENQEDFSDMSAMMAPSGNQEISDGGDSQESLDSSTSSSNSNENSDGEKDGNSNSGSSSDESDDDNNDATSDGDKTDIEENSTDSSSSDEKSEDSDSDVESKDNVAESQSEGSHGGEAETITATTDSSSKESSKEMLDVDAKDRVYAFIPKINLKEAIIDYKTIMDIWNKHYTGMSDRTWFDKSLSDLDTFTKDNKKTVSYMVKEFEMKKAADQYARASTSKTGSLDMGRLHTYKYNDDLFKKVTTLPGATNHGLVLFLDWSGSMAYNLQGTLNQLYNLIWFCKRTQIPFEVFAFTDQYSGDNKLSNFKPGDLIVEGCNLLQFFSSKMNNKELYKMMHNLNMYAGSWTRDYFMKYGAPRGLDLGGTPLGQAAACALEFVPKYKKETGVQKINTVFLTDGAGCKLDRVYHINTNLRTGDTYNGYQYVSWAMDLVLKDNMTNTTLFGKDYNRDTTAMLLELLRKRVPEMNIVNFFVAGSGRSGRVCKNTVRRIVRDKSEDWVVTVQKTKEVLKIINKENVGIFNNVDGFDQVYLLPGLNNMIGDESLDVQVGASKAQLKRAFGKMANGKLSNRPLLNNFVKMVA